MPIYEYECKACGHTLESFQKMSDQPLVQCPQCKQDALAKLVSSAGFQLKGTGWYATDFKNKGKPEQNPATKTESAKNDQSTSAPTSGSEKQSSSGSTSGGTSE